jgi:colanic acid/amylovoran biosynthesis glycosyltransferase
VTILDREGRIMGSLLIACVLYSYPAVSQTFVVREVRELRRLGVEVDTISLREPHRDDLHSDLDREESARTYSLLPLRPLAAVCAHAAALAAGPRTYMGLVVQAVRDGHPGIRGRFISLAGLALAVIVWHRCRRRGVRHVHCHFAGTPSDIASQTARVGNALAAERDGGWTWSQTVHGPVEFQNLDSLRLPERVREAAAVFTPSDFARSQILGMLEPSEWEKVRVIRYGLDPSCFASNPERPLDDTIEILTVARLVAIKGHAVLLDALAELERRGIAFHATIAGDGPERAALEARAEQLGLADAVSFLGAVGSDIVPSLYQRAHVFCLPSFAEGLPVSLIEAMASGVPVVTTRIMGTPELVEDGVSGLLVAPGRSDLLADALWRVCTDPELRRALADAGAAKVRSEFESTGPMEKLASALREIDGRGARYAGGPAGERAMRRPARAPA